MDHLDCNNICGTEIKENSTICETYYCGYLDITGIQRASPSPSLPPNLCHPHEDLRLSQQHVVHLLNGGRPWRQFVGQFEGQLYLKAVVLSSLSDHGRLIQKSHRGIRDHTVENHSPMKQSILQIVDQLKEKIDTFRVTKYVFTNVQNFL